MTLIGGVKNLVSPEKSHNAKRGAPRDGQRGEKETEERERTADDDGFDLELLNGVGEGCEGRLVPRVEALGDVALRERIKKRIS